MDSGRGAESKGREGFYSWNDQPNHPRHSVADPWRNNDQRHQIPGGEAHRQGFRNQWKLCLRAVESAHLSFGKADGNHYHNPAHLVSGAESQFLITGDSARTRVGAVVDLL